MACSAEREKALKNMLGAIPGIEEAMVKKWSLMGCMRWALSLKHADRVVVQKLEGMD
jgi:hypothetical protein